MMPAQDDAAKGSQIRQALTDSEAMRDEALKLIQSLYRADDGSPEAIR